MGKRVENARDAYSEKDLEKARKAHTKEAIHKEQHATDKGKYIGDFVYGSLDGIVTTFAVVSGVVGASLEAPIILILGFANLFADGLSMALGNFLGTKSEQDFYRKEWAREAWEVDNIPEGEREEVREIYRRKGFTGKLLDRVTEVITSKKERWVSTMMVEELGMLPDQKSPLWSAVATFGAFLLVGIVPLLSFITALALPGIMPVSFPVAVILTAVTIFAVGSARSLLIKKKWYIAGLEMLAVGGVAAIVAYYIGVALSFLA